MNARTAAIKALNIIADECCQILKTPGSAIGGDCLSRKSPYPKSNLEPVRTQIWNRQRIEYVLPFSLKLSSGRRFDEMSLKSLSSFDCTLHLSNVTGITNAITSENFAHLLKNSIASLERCPNGGLPTHMLPS